MSLSDNLDLGVTGAKRIRYYQNSPDALLRRLVETHPDLTEGELEDLFEEHVLTCGGEMVSAIIEYWFTNRYRAIMRSTIPMDVRKAERARKDKRLKERVTVIKKAAVASVARKLLEETAPGCGKTIADMTRKDCEKEGGWFMALGARVKGRSTVGRSGLSNDEIWKIYKQQK